MSVNESTHTDDVLSFGVKRQNTHRGRLSLSKRVRALEDMILVLSEEDKKDIILALTADGYHVTSLHDRDEAVQWLQSKNTDIMLMEVKGRLSVESLPQDILTSLRMTIPHIPVIFLLDRYDPENVVGSFEAGAQDVVHTAEDTSIVVARVRNVLSCTHPRHRMQSELEIGDMVIQQDIRQVWRAGIAVELTPKEFDLLLYLALQVNRVCTRRDILRHVWEHDYISDTNVVDVYIRHLRKKLDRGHRQKLIRTKRGVGYYIAQPE